MKTNSMAKRDLADIFSHSDNTDRKEESVKPGWAAVPIEEKTDPCVPSINPVERIEKQHIIYNNHPFISNNSSNINTNNSLNIGKDSAPFGRDFESSRTENNTAKGFSEFNGKEESANIMKPYNTHVKTIYNDNYVIGNEPRKVRLSDLFSSTPQITKNEKIKKSENFKRETNFINEEKITNISNNYNISINLMNNNQVINGIHNPSNLNERTRNMGSEQENITQHCTVGRVAKVEATVPTPFDTFSVKKEGPVNPVDNYMFNANPSNIVKSHRDAGVYPSQSNVNNWVNVNSGNVMNMQECNYVNPLCSDLNEPHSRGNLMQEKFSAESVRNSEGNRAYTLATDENIIVCSEQQIHFDRLEMKNYMENKKIEDTAPSSFDISNYGVLNNVQSVKINKSSFPESSIDNEQNENSINIIFNNTSINNKYINNNNLNDTYLNNMSSNMDMSKTSNGQVGVGKSELTDSFFRSPPDKGKQLCANKTNNTMSYVNTLPVCHRTPNSNEGSSYSVGEQTTSKETVPSTGTNTLFSSSSGFPSHAPPPPSPYSSPSNDISAESMHLQHSREPQRNTRRVYVDHLKNYKGISSMNKFSSDESVIPPRGNHGNMMHESTVVNPSGRNVIVTSSPSLKHCSMGTEHKGTAPATSSYLLKNNNSSDVCSQTGSMSCTPNFSSNCSDNYSVGYSGNYDSSHTSSMVLRSSREFEQRGGVNSSSISASFVRREEKIKEDKMQAEHKKVHKNTYQNQYPHSYQTGYQQRQHKNHQHHQSSNRMEPDEEEEDDDEEEDEEEEDEEEDEEEEEEEEEENEEDDDKNGSSEGDSSSDDNSREGDNNVTTSKKEVYTLIKKTYNRIDMNKIPRPIINLPEKKTKRSAKMFATCEYISPPSCFQPFIAIDTGKANPKFIRSSLYQIPLFADTLKLAKVPFGIILNPFARVTELERVDKIDMKDVINDKEENIEILRCPKCYAYIHANMLENISKSQICVFCEHTFFLNENVLFDMHQYNDKANPKDKTTSSESCENGISPLLKGSVDILLPPVYFNNSNTLKLTYTYLNKGVNQAASAITNKLKSFTQQFSNTLDSYDIISTNKQRLSRILSDAPTLVKKNSLSHDYTSETETQENVNSNTSLYLNFKKLKELLDAEKGEYKQTKTKRDNLFKMYPQMKKCLPPYFVFVVDCSYNALYTNITHTILEGIRYAVKNVKCEKTKIAIITYSREVFFYSCKDVKNGKGSSATNTKSDINNDNNNNGTNDTYDSKNNSSSKGNNQIFVMSSVDDPFIPLPFDELFFSCIEEYDKIDRLIDFIKSVTSMQACNSCGNSALKVAVEMLKERNGGGSVCMFYSSTPNYGVGAITKSKKDLNANFTEVKEKIFFDSILLDLYSYNISVDTFFISSNNTHVCVPSLQYLAQNTGGKILYIDKFIWQKDYKEIYMNIEDTLTSESTAYYCELKLRYSQHVSIKNLYCCNNNFNSILSVDTIKIPKIRSDHTFGFLFNYFDMIETKKKLYIQCACLYTNLHGERFVRIHTTHMNMTTSLSTVFRYTDAEALMGLLVRQLCTHIMLNDNYVKTLIDSLAEILFSYRVNCASSAHGGQLILPDTLKLLPLFVSCLLKHNVVKKDILNDLKVYSLIKLMSLPISSSLIYIYPILYLIHIKGRRNEIDSLSLNDEYFMPKVIPTSATKIYSNGIYLLDAATHFYLYFGFHSDQEFTKDILGEIPVEKNAHELSLTDTTNGQKIQRILSNISNIYHQGKYIPLVVVPAKSAQEADLISLCVEDMIGKEYSYVNFLCFIHKLVHRKIDES